jgi:glycosyltransferase involved in cell wall biosynthesis
MPRARVLIFGWADRIHLRRWARGLADRGYTIKVVSQGGQPIKGIETICLPRRGKLSYFRYASTAASEAVKFRPDVVHVHYAGGFGLWGVRAGLKPLVVSVWGSDIVDLPRRWLYRPLVKRTLKAAAAITATSEYLKAVVDRLMPEAGTKTSIVPFGVNVPGTFTPLPAEPVTICFIKAHEPLYGPDTLLKALVTVKESIPDIVLNMAGEGSMTPKLKRLIRDSGLEQNVNLVGFVDSDEISSFIEKHHFMVMPSRKEAFGVAVLEASACGRPVIASNTGGVPEVLVDGETGILVDKDDEDALARAILRLAKDADLREKMGQAGREFVRENYTWDRSLDMMTDLYERLLHEKD